MAVGVAVGGIAQLTGWEDKTAVTIVTAGAYAAITIVVFALLRWTVMERSYLQSRPWVVLFWTIIAAIGLIVPSAWLQEQMPQLPDMMQEHLAAIMDSKYGYYVVGLLVPFVEEMVFRGAILRALLQAFNRHWVAIGVSAVVFAVAHFNPAQMPHAAVVGVLLGWMYYRTKSIIPGIAYHWANNTAAYIIYNAMPDPDATLIDLLGSEVIVLKAIVFSIIILVPAIYQLNVWMKPADKI